MSLHETEHPHSKIKLRVIFLLKDYFVLLEFNNKVYIKYDFIT